VLVAALESCSRVSDPGGALAGGMTAGHALLARLVALQVPQKSSAICEEIVCYFCDAHVLPFMLLHVLPFMLLRCR
jgi:hypothetical protein